MEIKLFTEKQPLSNNEKVEVGDCLYKHLDEFGDPREAIMKSIHYAFKDIDAFGGFVLVAREGEDIKGAVVINKTGMGGYIPDNILVYIAVHRDQRGQGLGKKLMKETLDTAEGDVKLHVEHNNPARFLYKKVGFTSKYMEMRYNKQ
ncbi:MAG: GNAT family N-acetyltransferase [Candidatus Delongbacteria bacterium]|jgi:ribosomal-protein-alanine N-acetyltransferase|nr:GNAT family N-acetyltransferase [Candidatus Delongbacteria bacterium]